MITQDVFIFDVFKSIGRKTSNVERLVLRGSV